MIDFLTSKVGTNNVNSLAMNVAKGQQYTITGFPFRSKSGSKSVACHRQTYAYAVYYCHETEHTTTARVSLMGEDGCRGEGVAVCHTDMSAWNPEHLAFKVLNIKPGGAPVCHFIPNDHIVWLAANQLLPAISSVLTAHPMSYIVHVPLLSNTYVFII